MKEFFSSIFSVFECMLRVPVRVDIYIFETSCRYLSIIIRVMIIYDDDEYQISIKQMKKKNLE